MKTLRMIWLMLIGALLLGPFSWSSARSDQSLFGTIKRGHQWLETMHQESPASYQTLLVTPQPIDVEHYKLQLRLTPSPAQIAGVVTIEGETTNAVSAIQVDAANNLIIDAVQFNGAARTFRRATGKITLDFPESLPAGVGFTVVVTYRGVPVTDNLLGGGMLVSRHGSDNFPVMATLSEPYAAPTWWPCVDNPADKTTAEIEITVPSGYVATSNGVLEHRQPNADRTMTYFWRESYPIANYLIAVTATNFVEFGDTYTALDGRTTMPLVYYVYPEHLSQAQQKFPVTRKAIEIFAPLFGEYPFLREKYGMVEFPWGGAMEHQTLTSLGVRIVDFPDAVVQDFISHELSHQWWGDLVTMKTWNDIWLNEGFATYSEVLFFERFWPVHPGELMDESYDDHRAFGQLSGTVYAENAANPWDDPSAIYTKGAWVLHMLRHVMGDERFFAALKDYGQRFAFANASTDDFRRVCEDHYGQPLDWFFQQWVYAPARPIYRASRTISPADASGEYTITLTLTQQQPQQIPGREGPLAQVYIMPLDATLHYADGTSETRVIWNDARQQQFSFRVQKQPVDLTVDEDHWVLKELRVN